jgi:RNA polymerase sigma-70 factor (ECF subfamily)
MTLARDALREEAMLVERLKRGDEDAFEDLVRDHSGRLIGVARRILGDEDLARDAVQDAFLNAFRAFDGFNGEARLGSWLHRIVVNAALAKLRQRRRRPESFLTDEFPGGADGDFSYLEAAPASEGHGEAADDSLARRQEEELVRDCIARMKESHRTVLTLRYIDEYDTEQTARILGIAPNTVKTRLLRARDALRDYIEREVELASELLCGPAATDTEQRSAA